MQAALVYLELLQYSEIGKLSKMSESDLAIITVKISEFLYEINYSCIVVFIDTKSDEDSSDSRINHAHNAYLLISFL
jgi:hypothetical protein